MKYKKIGTLGEGSFGKVYLATDENDEQVAIKSFLISKKTSTEGIINLKELDIFTKCDHPYINKIINVTYRNPFKSKLSNRKYKKDKLFIISDVAKYSLHFFIYKTKPEISNVKKIMYQILSGLYYLHANSIIHRDMKPGNILCYPNKNGEIDIKITDFGLSKRTCKLDKNTIHVVTLNYKPPEILLRNDRYNEKIDIWSTGCIFFEILTKSDLFEGDSEINILVDIFRILGTPSETKIRKISGGNVEKNINISNSKKIDSIDELIKMDPSYSENFDKSHGKYTDLIDLINKMIAFDPDDRPTAWECLNHKFFEEVENKQKFIEQKKYHILQKTTHKYRELGLPSFIELAKNKGLTRVVFQGLDIYDRCLLKMPMRKNIDYMKVAKISMFIACKFFHDESTPPFNVMFPDSTYKKCEIEKVEKTIVSKYLKNVIYRETIYDLLENKKSSKPLLNMMLYDDEIYNDYNIRGIAKEFNMLYRQKYV
jgi:serine/threonine protein kinase